MKWISYLKYKWAWVKWFFNIPFKLGDRSLGSGEIRRRNINLLLNMHLKREPKLKDFLK